MKTNTEVASDRFNQLVAHAYMISCKHEDLVKEAQNEMVEELFNLLKDEGPNTMAAVCEKVGLETHYSDEHGIYIELRSLYVTSYDKSL